MRLLELSGCFPCMGQAEVVKKVPKGVKRVVRLTDVNDVMKALQHAYAFLRVVSSRHKFQRVLDEECLKDVQDCIEKLAKIHKKLKRRWMQVQQIPRYVLTRRGVLRKERTIVFS